MSSDDLRKRLETVEAALARLRGQDAGLGADYGSMPQDFGDSGQDLQMREELEGQIADLEAERDRIKAKLGREGSPDKADRSRH
ncbi:hypothetical protein [Actinomadura harenae]|uniref:Uncharacterized protein n=1 Tax=Actinomadura harenae TaxID=2483351 RepID=A0A3M2LUZ0_9ACTN|nr:hypothetical protein [Actinomadura harenae]RMI41271.1 hypothetical protein EBO15_23595 [Actinomadura harenae]